MEVKMQLPDGTTRHEGKIRPEVQQRITEALQVLVMGVAASHPAPPPNPPEMMIALGIAYGMMLAATGVRLPDNLQMVVNAIEAGYTGEIEARANAPRIMVPGGKL